MLPHPPTPPKTRGSPLARLSLTSRSVRSMVAATPTGSRPPTALSMRPPSAGRRSILSAPHICAGMATRARKSLSTAAPVGGRRARGPPRSARPGGRIPSRPSNGSARGPPSLPCARSRTRAAPPSARASGRRVCAAAQATPMGDRCFRTSRWWIRCSCRRIWRRAGTSSNGGGTAKRAIKCGHRAVMSPSPTPREDPKTVTHAASRVAVTVTRSR